MLRTTSENDLTAPAFYFINPPYFFPFKLTDSLLKLAASFLLSFSAPMKLVSQVGFA